MVKFSQTLTLLFAGIAIIPGFVKVLLWFQNQDNIEFAIFFTVQLLLLALSSPFLLKSLYPFAEIESSYSSKVLVLSILHSLSFFTSIGWASDRPLFMAVLAVVALIPAGIVYGMDKVEEEIY